MRHSSVLLGVKTFGRTPYRASNHSVGLTPARQDPFCVRSRLLTPCRLLACLCSAFVVIPSADASLSIRPSACLSVLAVAVGSAAEQLAARIVPLDLCFSRPLFSMTVGGSLRQPGFHRHVDELMLAIGRGITAHAISNAYGRIWCHTVPPVRFRRGHIRGTACGKPVVVQHSVIGTVIASRERNSSNTF